MRVSDKLNMLMKKLGFQNPYELSKKMEEANYKVSYTTLLRILGGRAEDIKLGVANKFKDFFNLMLPLDEKLILDDLLDDSLDIESKLKSLNKVNLVGLNDNQLTAMNKYADYLRSLD